MEGGSSRGPGLCGGCSPDTARPILLVPSHDDMEGEGGMDTFVAGICFVLEGGKILPEVLEVSEVSDIWA